MPIPFDFDMVAFAWTTLKVIFGSKARLRKNARPIPMRFEVELIAEDQLTAVQREYLKPIDAQLLALNYRPLCTFRAKNFGANLVRRYANPADPASCALTVVEVKVEVNGVKGVKNSCSAEFATRFSEGKRLSTRNMALKSLFDQPPYRTVQECPNITNLAELKRKHDALARNFGAPCPASQDAASVLEEFQVEHERYSKYQVECGNYRMAPDGNSYLLSDRVYERGIRNHFLPFGKRISLAHVLFSALIGSVLPLFGILKLAPWLARGPYQDIAGILPISCVAIAACYLLAGIIMGLVCDVQKFTWIMIITYLPAHLVAGWSFGLYPYSTIAFLGSYYAAQALRRRSLVLQT
jgi:hypothetical protein